MEALEKIDDALTKAEDVLSDVLYAEDSLERLEPCAGKLACTVLRRVVVGNGHYLSDSIGLHTPKTPSFLEHS